MPNKIKNIPLNEILEDSRVRDYIRRKTIEWTKKNIGKFKNNQSQILSCHSWLLTLHYQAITLLQEKYNISKPEFIVLLGAYMFKRMGNNGFKANDLSSSILKWQHNRIYRHLNNLSSKGYIRIERNPHSGLQLYFVTSDSDRVIRAFNQHYARVFGEVWEKLGDLPKSFDSSY